MEFTFNFKNAVVKSGSKAVDESKPLLEIVSTMNNFRLNRKALQALGIGVGDRVVMYDLGSNAVDLNNRWFISADYEIDGKSVGSKITNNNTFTYSIVYGAMLAQDPDVISISPMSLIERGLLYDRTEGKNTQYIATKVAVCDLEVVANGEPQLVADGVSRVLYRICNFRWESHIPKVTSIEFEE